MGHVTMLIDQARGGDRAAFDRLFELLYPDLRRIAHRRLARSQGVGQSAPIQTTALVNECYMKFVQREDLTPADRSHFLAYAASMMRSIVVDAARAALSQRRGGGAQLVTLNTDLIDGVPDAADEILDVHAALDELGRVDARLARVVEMRYFGGLDDDAIGEVLALSSRTVRRDWDKARLLLAHALRRE